METKESIFKRRSIRKFTDDCVHKEDILLLLEAAMAAPSACNKRPWEFYVIESLEKLQEVKKVTRFGRYDAPLAIVVCGNKNKALSDKDNDFWIQDCSAAIENILLCAVSLGLGSVWCGLYPMENPVNKMREVINVDENIVPLGLIYIGYPDITVEGRTQYDEACVHYL